MDAPRQITVLLVDDNEAAAYVHGRVFRRAGLDVITASYGSLGLELAQRHAPDVIVLDMNLPDIQGPAVCRALKASPATRDIPVLFTSAAVDDEQLEDAMAAGGVGFLRQPLLHADAVATIRALADAARHKRAQGQQAG